MKVKIEGKLFRNPKAFFEKPVDVKEQYFDLIESKDKKFQAYLQNELQLLPGNKFKSLANPINVVIKYPLGMGIKSIRKWLSKADKHFKTLPARGEPGFYDTHRGRWIKNPMVKRYSDIAQPWGSATHTREFYNKRDQWIKESYARLNKKHISDREAYEIIKGELLLKRKAFGSCEGAKREPFNISLSAIEKIVRYK